MILQDTARQERQAKDRLSREKDVLIAEKFNLEQALAVSEMKIVCYFILLVLISKGKDDLTQKEVQTAKSIFCLNHL